MTNAYKIARGTGFATLALLALLTGEIAQAAERSRSLRALLVAYRCEVVGRLERIYAHGDPREHFDRFIAVTAPRHAHGYVQCMFHDNRNKLLCEASSGFHFDPPGAPRTFRLPATEVAALGGLGFSTDDSRGNFRIDFDVAAPPDFNAVADLILTALHDGYGVRGDDLLKFNAPFARRPETSCIPMS